MFTTNEFFSARRRCSSPPISFRRRRKPRCSARSDSLRHRASSFLLRFAERTVRRRFEKFVENVSHRSTTGGGKHREDFSRFRRIFASRLRSNVHRHQGQRPTGRFTNEFQRDKVKKSIRFGRETGSNFLVSFRCEEFLQFIGNAPNDLAGRALAIEQQLVAAQQIESSPRNLTAPSSSIFESDETNLRKALTTKLSSKSDFLRLAIVLTSFRNRSKRIRQLSPDTSVDSFRALATRSSTR